MYSPMHSALAVRVPDPLTLGDLQFRGEGRSIVMMASLSLSPAGYGDFFSFHEGNAGHAELCSMYREMHGMYGNVG